LPVAPIESGIEAPTPNILHYLDRRVTICLVILEFIIEFVWEMLIPTTMKGFLLLLSIVIIGSLVLYFSGLL
jgi:hypothetical protein